ncbi:peptidylprolyl isomerase [Sunxiuqinia dokdonensis]|uniref:peptidylprolyl isomerase n=1 Tax=Sunxiuqinia dokdonensis TaxID=1409788 RepID=A0A0L8V518_9BACT|nr:peptidylprolyl isomerase [Sunxiuqinia dokdonensis]KOH43287.1 peptidylprolyl isomerase [Sunxiuqinia dokdonensis]
MKRIVLLIIFGLFLSGVVVAQRIVEVKTNLGAMRFELYDDTPKHRDALIKLAGEGYYDGTLFYRVIENFLIQGGSKSSRNAPPGKRIGYGDPDHTVDDEIRSHYFHQKGALCAPRQPDEVNPFKQSDISQFYIVKGQVFTSGYLDTLELAVNRPIRQEITSQYYTPEIKQKLKELKAAGEAEAFNALLRNVKSDIESRYELHPGKLKFSDAQRQAYTTVGGYPDLDGKYTIFGQCISGFEVIDRIAALKTDENNRPLQDVKIEVNVIE